MQSLGKRTTMSYKMMSGGEGVCLECGAPFRGRSDKHFCSLSCKNAYHNRAQQTKRRHRSDILAVLTCNYGILEALLKEGRGSARLEELAALGFDPAYVTGHRRGRFGHNEYACFDILFCRSDTRVFNVRRDPIPISR